VDLPRELVERAKLVVDSNRYLTLGTTEPDGRSRVSPVYFTHVGYRDFYWVSSPAARHSANIAARPDVAIVVFDSSVPAGAGQAVYIAARAAVVSDADLPRRCAEAFATVEAPARPFAPDELSGDADLRLYRAEATAHEVHVAASDPLYGVGRDSRRQVLL